MSIHYGVELEAFVQNRATEELVVPKGGVPTDSFPLLAEFRTNGPIPDLLDALSLTSSKLLRYEIQRRDYIFNKSKSDWRVPDSIMSELRGHSYTKGGALVHNIYGKVPRFRRTRTYASLQLSFSEMVAPATDKTPVLWSVFPYAPLIRALDEEFKREIRAAGRTPGCYCVKGPRIEYRSLPNTVFWSSGFMERAYRVVENWKKESRLY
jgi:hypothetical protein